MRSLSVPVILVAALLVAGALLPAAEAQGGPRNPTAEERSGNGRDDTPPTSPPTSPPADEPRDNGGDADDNAGRGNSEERRRDDEARERRNVPPTPVPIGAFEVDLNGGAATGEFVSLRYGADGVEAETADGVRLFNLTQINGSFTGIRDVDARGSKIKLQADDVTVVVHDNPTAASRIDADGPLSIELGPDAVITGDGNRFGFTIQNVSGTIKADHVERNGTRFVFDGDFLLLLDNMRAAADSHRPAILEAIGRGHVGAEASFARIENGIEEDVVSYGNVTMTTLRAERGELTVLVDGHGLEGRVLVLNVEGSLVGASASDQLRILFDNETIAHADDLVDVLDPDNDGLQAEYYVVFDPAREVFQLIVSVPHYSVHTLSVTLVELAPSVVLGIVAGVALLAPSAWLLFRRPRQ